MDGDAKSAVPRAIFKYIIYGRAVSWAAIPWKTLLRFAFLATESGMERDSPWDKKIKQTYSSDLAKAFRGELVPTEFELAQAEGRSFESAEELLARIRNAGAADLNGNSAKPQKEKQTQMTWRPETTRLIGPTKFS